MSGVGDVVSQWAAAALAWVQHGIACLFNHLEFTALLLLALAVRAVASSIWHGVDVLITHPRHLAEIQMAQKTIAEYMLDTKSEAKITASAPRSIGRIARSRSGEA
jgi:hypothetical protein